MANDNGNPALTASVTLNIRFYDPDSLPYFPENQRLLHIQFTENVTGLEESKSIPQASYNFGEDEEDWEFEVYYLLLDGDDGLFNVDLKSGEITLKEMLDREEEDYYQLKIIASNSESLPSNYDDQSVLVVEIEVKFIFLCSSSFQKCKFQVLDVNDNPPHFNRSYYSNGISTITALQSTIITASVLSIVIALSKVLQTFFQAYDLDKDESLKFSIVENSLQAIGTGISELSAPFVIGEDSGIIVLNFRVQATMDGYFIFTIQVMDSREYFDI